MTGERDDEVPDAVPDRAVESALASVARPSARPAFRDELRRRFCTERLGSGGLGSGTTGSGHLAPLASFPEPGRDPRVARRRTLLRVGGLLAAASILAIGFVVLESPAPRWKVLEVAAGSLVEIDGRQVPVDDRSDLGRALQRAKEIRVVQGDVVLQIEDLALFDVAEGTRVVFDGFDRRAPGAPYSIQVPSGRLRAITGPAFQGRTMNVQADVIDATITGTAFAVDYEDHGTCVCCLHGEVAVSSRAIESGPRKIEPTKMCLVYRDGKTPPKWGANPPKHLVPLEALEARARGIWP